MLEVNGQRKLEKPKQTWRKQVEESMKEIKLKVEVAASHTRWREGVRAIAKGIGCIWPLTVTKKNAD